MFFLLFLKFIRYADFAPQVFNDLAEYLLVKTAAVIMGVKPAVLLRLTKGVCRRNAEWYEHFRAFAEEMQSILKLEGMVLKETEKDLQVLFYEKRALERMLLRPENRAFLETYGKQVDFTDFGALEPITREIQRGTI